MTNIEKIDEMVRDFCSVAPKSKSEVRQRISESIHQAIAEERQRVVREAEKVKFTIYDGDIKREVVGLEDVKHIDLLLKQTRERITLKNNENNTDNH